MTHRRRQFLRSSVAIGVATLAGCSGGSGSQPTYTADTVTASDEMSSYLSDTSNFEGSALDWTGREEVEVVVGARGNGNFYAYGPPAIVVDTGTTVVWTWNGKGQAHNVVAEDGTFNSGAAQLGEDITFEYTFEQAGTYRYFCTPHRVNGMKGVVVVE